MQVTGAEAAKIFLETYEKGMNSPASDGYRLLVARFRSMAEIRQKHGLRERAEGKIHAAMIFERAADAYDRCADEVQAVVDGKIPPAVGEPWPESSR